ncbi:MAG: glycosyltransferase family 4 protein [Patescibacteria group bacterium]|nr:glycosyltransferase family 4 protein [Patescibacteria group bacterium]
MKNIASKVLFVYSGVNRADSLNLWQCGKSPDNQLFGYNHINNNFSTGIDFINGLSFDRKNIKKIFNLLKYDFILSPAFIDVFAIMSPLFFIKKNKWIIFNINLNNVLHKSSTLKRLIFLFFLKRVFKIICLSSYQKKVLLDYGISERKLVVIPFGVDKHFYSYSEGDGGYILSVGRDNGRDYKTLVEAVKDLSIQTIIVCSKKNIENLDGKIPSNIKILFDIDYLSLRDLYKNARLVVIPAKSDNHLDGSDCSGQTAMLEAMACGKTVLATYRRSLDDYLVNNINSIVIDPENPEIMRKKIKEIFNDKQKLKKIGLLARKSIDEEFNSESMANKMYNLLK